MFLVVVSVWHQQTPYMHLHTRTCICACYHMYVVRACVCVCAAVWLSLCAAYENSVAQRSSWCTQNKTKTAHKLQLAFTWRQIVAVGNYFVPIKYNCRIKANTSVHRYMHGIRMFKECYRLWMSEKFVTVEHLNFVWIPRTHTYARTHTKRAETRCIFATST